MGDAPRPHDPYFLWRKERSKETSTPSKASPYMGRMQLKIAESADFQGFGMARKACAPTGRAMIFYRLRLEPAIR